MSKKTDQIKFMQAMFPNAKFVECKYIEEGQRVADDSKTIDHIADISKKVSLTEQYQTGTLPNGFYYFDNGKNQYIVDYHNIQGFEGLEGVKVPERVPSYKEWQQMKAFCEGFNTLEVSEENQKLKELLTDICCELVDDEEDMTNGLLQYFNTDVIDRIKEALK